MPQQIPDDVLAVLAEAHTREFGVYLQGKLDRPLYARVNKVLEAAGGKWSKSAGCHVFEGDAAEIVEGLVLTGEYTNQKRDLNAFFSPPAVVDELLRRARIDTFQLVLEPSAGEGAIALAAAERWHALVTAYEINAPFANKTRMLLKPFGGECRCSDFIQAPPSPVFDRVIMNPPFAHRRDILHVQHALGWLAPGGRLVSVMSPGFTFRTDRLSTGFREMVEQRGGTVEPLPDGSFSESGTDVRTVIVTIDRRG